MDSETSGEEDHGKLCVDLNYDAKQVTNGATPKDKPVGNLNEQLLVLKAQLYDALEVKSKLEATVKKGREKYKTTVVQLQTRITELESGQGGVRRVQSGGSLDGGSDEMGQELLRMQQTCKKQSTDLEQGCEEITALRAELELRSEQMAALSKKNAVLTNQWNTIKAQLKRAKVNANRLKTELNMSREIRTPQRLPSSAARPVGNQDGRSSPAPSPEKLAKWLELRSERIAELQQDLHAAEVELQQKAQRIATLEQSLSEADLRMAAEKRGLQSRNAHLEEFCEDAGQRVGSRSGSDSLSLTAIRRLLQTLSGTAEALRPNLPTSAAAMHSLFFADSAENRQLAQQFSLVAGYHAYLVNQGAGAEIEAKVSALSGTASGGVPAAGVAAQRQSAVNDTSGGRRSDRQEQLGLGDATASARAAVVMNLPSLSLDSSVGMGTCTVTIGGSAVVTPVSNSLGKRPLSSVSNVNPLAPTEMSRPSQSAAASRSGPTALKNGEKGPTSADTKDSGSCFSDERGKGKGKGDAATAATVATIPATTTAPATSSSRPPASRDNSSSRTASFGSSVYYVQRTEQAVSFRPTLFVSSRDTASSTGSSSDISASD